MEVVAKEKPRVPKPRAPRAVKPQPWQVVIPLPSRDNHVTMLRYAGAPSDDRERKLSLRVGVCFSCDACGKLRVMLERKAKRQGGGPTVHFVTIPKDGDHHCATAVLPPLSGDFSHTLARSSEEGETDRRTAATPEEVNLGFAALKSAIAEPRTRNPLPHQAKAKAYARRHAPHVFHLKWRMGLGKTEGAGGLVCGDALPHKRLTVWVTHNTLVGEAASFMRSGSRQAPDTWSEIHVVGFNEFNRICTRNPAWLEGALVVVDEAHAFRNVTKPMQVDLHALRYAAHLVLLTGTPLQNDPDDLRGYLALLRLWTPEEAADMSKPLPSPTQLRVMLTRAMPHVAVSFCDPHADPRLSVCFPLLEDSTVKVPMSWLDALKYDAASGKNVTYGPVTIAGPKANSFDMVSRLMCNTQAKVDRMVADIPSMPRPQLIYSNFRERGSDLIMAGLKKTLPHIRQDSITGSTPTGQRHAIQERFRKGLLDVLRVSEAAKEGLDLPNAQSCQIMESMVTEESKQQLRGRVQRFIAEKKPKVKRVKKDDADDKSGAAQDLAEDEDEDVQEIEDGIVVEDTEDVGSTGALPHAPKRKVKIVQYISTFPDHPPTEAEKRELRDYFRSVVVGERNFKMPFVPDGFDVVPHLLANIKKHGGTSDERLEIANDRKHKTITPFLNVLDTIGLMTTPEPIIRQRVVDVDAVVGVKRSRKNRPQFNIAHENLIDDFSCKWQTQTPF